MAQSSLLSEFALQAVHAVGAEGLPLEPLRDAVLVEQVSAVQIHHTTTLLNHVLANATVLLLLL